MNPNLTVNASWQNGSIQLWHDINRFFTTSKHGKNEHNKRDNLIYIILSFEEKGSKAYGLVWMVQVGDPNMDHRCWERPEDMDTPRNVYKVSDQNPGSDVAAETAAALAAASIVFKDSDPSYSAKLLHTAMKVNILTNYIHCLPVLCFIHLINKQLLFTMMQVFDFADRHRGSYSDSLNSVVCPFYCSYSGYHVRLLHLLLALFILRQVLDPSFIN